MFPTFSCCCVVVVTVVVAHNKTAAASSVLADAADADADAAAASECGDLAATTILFPILRGFFFRGLVKNPRFCCAACCL